jgi:endonuclease III
LDTKTINKLYSKLHKKLAGAKSELDYKNNFELLIAVLLSAQSTDKTVNSVTKYLFVACPSPEAFLEAGETKVRILIKRIGLAPTKAKNIIKTCTILLNEHQGQIPNNRKALENLPGVGRKTANVVLNEGFGVPTIAVDTHVFRVSNRTGLSSGKTVELVEEKLLKVTPKKWLLNAHRYLILHGRYICKAKNFSCKECVILNECEFTDKVL